MFHKFWQKETVILFCLLLLKYNKNLTQTEKTEKRNKSKKMILGSNNSVTTEQLFAQLLKFW